MVQAGAAVYADGLPGLSVTSSMSEGYESSLLVRNAFEDNGTPNAVHISKGSASLSISGDAVAVNMTDVTLGAVDIELESG